MSHPADLPGWDASVAAAARELLAAASPRPWVQRVCDDEPSDPAVSVYARMFAAGDYHDRFHLVSVGDSDLGVAVTGNGPTSEAHAALIAAAPDLLERALAEIDRLLERAEAAERLQDRFAARHVEDQAEVERLRSGLRKYGRHTPECSDVSIRAAEIDGVLGPCTCGLDSALTGDRGTGAATERHHTVQDDGDCVSWCAGCREAQRKEM